MFFSGFSVRLTPDGIECLRDIKSAAPSGAFKEEMFKKVRRTCTVLVFIARTRANPPTQC